MKRLFSFVYALMVFAVLAAPILLKNVAKTFGEFVRVHLSNHMARNGLMLFNSFSKEERVAFDQLLAGFEDALVLSSLCKVYRTNQTEMERTNDIIWRPQPYILPSYDGLDQTANFNGKTQLSVPATIGFKKSVPWLMSPTELRDALQEDRLFSSAKQRIASDINVSANRVASYQGTLVVKRSGVATGFDDVAQCEAIMNEQGVQMNDRNMGLSTRDYNSAASDLQKASRSFGNAKSDGAYEKAYIGRVSSFETFKMDYTPRIVAAAGVTVTVNGNQYYTPRATSTASSGEVSNVDNRYMNLAITVSSGTVKIGDAFTIQGVNAVHHITKEDTGQLKTFRVTGIVSGSGGTGTIQISPPVISATGATQAEVQYQNVTTQAATGAPIVWLNTVTNYMNPFWTAEGIEILPGRYALEENAGLQVMRGSTKQGFDLVFTKQGDINTLNFKYRVDCLWGVAMVNPEMAGIIMFSQS